MLVVLRLVVDVGHVPTLAQVRARAHGHQGTGVWASRCVAGNSAVKCASDQECLLTERGSRARESNARRLRRSRVLSVAFVARFS
jgi:hypothetical protein